MGKTTGGPAAGGGRLVSRKERRKRERAERKSRIAKHFSRKRTQTSPVSEQVETVSKPSSTSKRQKSDVTHGSRKKGHGSVDPAISREDREISRLERLMGVKKRKRLPSYFKDDGLDYLLDVTDRSANWALSDEEDELSDGDEKSLSSKRIFDQGSDQESDSSDCDEDSGNGSSRKKVRFDLGEQDACDEEESEEETLEDEEEESEEDPPEDVPKEETKLIAYVSPHRRRENDVKLEQLMRRIQGLINRLSESNMKSIVSQLEQLYTENSRNDMNHTVTEVLLKACLQPVLLGDKFAMEHMMVITLLHNNIGTDVGAYFIQALAERLDKLLENPLKTDKQSNCAILLFSHLYNYRVIHCLLIYDIIRRLVERFTEQDVELLLLLLKNCGMEIRRDDATSLRDIILQIQSKAVSSSLSDSSRVQFMLDVIAAIKSNNVRKIPNYDPSLLEHSRKLLKGLSHNPSILTEESQLKISLCDLLNADKQGRWWIVGSSWSTKETNTSEANPRGSDVTVSSRVMDAARKQRMNTEVRRNVFSVLMTSEDYIDAFERLTKMNLREVQERELVHVTMDCCLQEKSFNLFYALLTQKLCEYKRSHQITLQYAFWDKFKDLGSLSTANLTNLRLLLAHLIVTRSLPLAVVRVVEFSELNKVGIRWFKQLLQSLLCDYSSETCRSVFSCLAPHNHLRTLRDDLMIFMRHFLVSQQQDTSSSHPSSLVQSRIKTAEQAMRDSKQ